MEEDNPDAMRVGLTGGIGSGKSTVARIFETLDVPVYYADERARELMTEDPELILGIKELLGEDVYREDGSLHREMIAARVFADRSLLEKLNGLVHPAVFRDSARWHEEQISPYTLKEAALLFESGSADDLDYIIVVTAPEQVRLERVMQRDGVAKEKVLARMRNQWPEADKVKGADFLIRNDGHQFLIPQVLDIHRQILSQLKSSKA